MKQEPYIYLHARNCQRYRYNVALQTFENCYPAKRTLMNKICCKQWGQWRAIDHYLSYALVEALKVELVQKLGFMGTIETTY